MATTHNRRRIALAMGAMLLGACAVGPDYRAAPVKAPDRWQATTDSAPSALDASPHSDDAEALQRWWTWFEDDNLDALIDMAMAQNLDVRAAGARLRAARAERRAAAAGLGPRLGMGVGSERTQNPMPGLAPGLTFTQHEIGFDARWEIDLFGRHKRRVEAADALVEASQAEVEAAMTVLCAEVARSYWEMRASDAGIVIQHAAIELARRDAHHAKRRADAGIGTRDAALAADARIQVARTELVALELARSTAQRQVEQLLGVEPGKLAVALHARSQPLPQFAPRLLLTPTAVLRNRPDIQRAERQLAAATALKAAAIADLYPRISIGMFFGLRNTALSALMSMASKSWSGGGSVLQPLFDGGRLRAMVEARDADIESAMVAFERANLDALHETEQALAQWLAAERGRDANSAILAASEQAVALASHRQRQGVADAREVIAAELAQLEARAALTRSEADVTVSTVAVLKALGAGIHHADAGATVARAGVAGSAP
ncbi:MAG: efflux transporter outer membrane subunit [Proteobacteria bacterium]|nr:efflux transporter outer membrane subunit [Pseudomonadota bacterium]